MIIYLLEKINNVTFFYRKCISVVQGLNVWAEQNTYFKKEHLLTTTKHSQIDKTNRKFAEEKLRNHNVIAMKIYCEMTSNLLTSLYLYDTKYWAEFKNFQRVENEQETSGMSKKSLGHQEGLLKWGVAKCVWVVAELFSTGRLNFIEYCQMSSYISWFIIKSSNQSLGCRQWLYILYKGGISSITSMAVGTGAYSTTNH